jgi:hypothetical protein
MYDTYKIGSHYLGTTAFVQGWNDEGTLPILLLGYCCDGGLGT